MPTIADYLRELEYAAKQGMSIDEVKKEKEEKECINRNCEASH